MPSNIVYINYHVRSKQPQHLRQKGGDPIMRLHDDIITCTIDWYGIIIYSKEKGLLFRGFSLESISSL